VPWVVASAVGIALPPGIALSATFEGERVGGSAGCNRYTGPYAADGDGLELGAIAVTRMACLPPLDLVESAYLAALARVSGWRLEGDSLVLLDGDDQELLRYEVASPLGEWQASGFLSGDGFSSAITGTEITGTFGDAGVLSGSAGCNRYTASYAADRGAIEITAPASTRKVCAGPEGIMEQEAVYLSLLPTAARYRLDGRLLELLDTNRRRLVSYARAGPR
jgi:heat shock protein HslJ